MKFAVSTPQLVGDGMFDPAELRDYLAAADALGFESVWAQEHTFGSQPVLAPLEMLTFAAACNERLRLGCAVFVMPTRSPVHLAKAVSSVDQLSRGRLEIGLGVGGGGGLEAFGVSPRERAPRLEESVQLMRACWTQDPVQFDGRFWQVHGQTMAPPPFQKPGPPIWIGGSHPNALRRAVAIGDGFFGAGSRTTAAFTEQMRVIRAELEAAGRDPASFPIAKRVYTAIGDDREAVRSRMAAAIAALYGTDSLADVMVAGTPDDVIAGYRAVAAAGAERILVNLLYDDHAQMQRIAAEVLPAVG